MRRSKSEAQARGGAGGGGTAAVNAIHSPSGLKTGEPRSPSIRKASPAGTSIRRNHVPPPVLPSAPGRRELNASIRPSGVHAGDEALKLGLVSRTGSPDPSAAASRISLWRRFSSSTTQLTTYATREPSGDSAGLPTSLSR